jgi:ElaB/YqjD/DUF883 family membrane-anchored ribosome-binding protein
MLEASMSTNTEGAAENFTADLAALRQDIASMADRLTKLVQHQAQSAGHSVSETVGDVTDKIAGATENAQKSVCAAGQEIEARIERNPMTSVLIAFGVGVSLGLLNRLRR